MLPIRVLTSAGAGDRGAVLLAAMLAESPIIAYDNNDLSTFFLDHTGTTQASINGVCGLQLDKSQGLVLGPELFDEADLSLNPTTGTATVLDGVITATGATAVGTNVQQQNAPITLGRFYEITINVTSISAGTIRVSVGNDYSPLVTTAGVHKFKVLYSAGLARCYIALAGPATAMFSYSVRELPGYHRYQATTASKPVLRGTPTEPNFFDSYDTPAAGWTDNGDGSITASAASSGQLTVLNQPIVAGRVYRVQYTMTRSAGGLTPNIGGVSLTFRNAAGTYTQYVTAISTVTLRLIATSGYTGTVSDIIVEDCTADAVSAPYFLQYDGTDDFMVTASVNLTATDSITGCFGAMRLAETEGVFAEFSTQYNLNNGSFNFQARANDANGYTMYIRGQTSAVALSAADTGRQRRVITGQSKIAPVFSHLIRRDGVQQSIAITDVGTGNFGNYVIYFGRRGGTSSPFNGYDYGFALFPIVKSGADLTAIEAFMADRTGVTL